MKWIATSVALTFLWTSTALAGGGHHHDLPTLKNKTKTIVTTQGTTITVTFGPIDLPVGHSGDLAASMPKHLFELAEDKYLVGYKANVYLKDGTPLPPQYLHHILLMDNDQESVSCPGEPLFFAGAGMEMTEARFPPGYGVKLEKGHKLMALVAFYHKVPPTQDVMASFTMEMAPRGADIQPMDVYQVGVNIVCFSKFSKRADDETDEGMLIRSGVDVRSAPLKFQMDGCTKFAYPHGHDQLLLIALDNKTTGQTLLRTVPDVGLDGSFRSFQPHQVYRDPVGFPVNTEDEIKTLWDGLEPDSRVSMDPGMKLTLKFMLVSAQRKGEVLNSEWSEFDLDAGWWELPGGKTKNKKVHRVSLSPLALEILAEAKQASKDSKWVFPSPFGPKKRGFARTPGLHPLTGPAVDHAVRRSLKTFGIEHFVPHDIRRSGASMIAGLGIPRLTIKKILNHADSEITGIYDRHTYDSEKQKAMLAWDRKLRSIIKGKKAKILPIQKFN